MAKYRHTRPETLRQQVEQALRRWPESLKEGFQSLGATKVATTS
jgi:hypothetical protein